MYKTSDIKKADALDKLHVLNSDIGEIVRGETAAYRAYEKILESVLEEPERFKLKQFRLDHEDAISYWRSEAKLSGTFIESDTSVWGHIVNTLVGVSSLFGNETALRALKKGEEHGLSIYERMLTSNMLTPIQRDQIKKTFVPRQKRHIESIDEIIRVQ